MAQNVLSPDERARLISEEKVHLDIVYFSDLFIEMLRDNLDEATGLALFQKGSRGELRLQQSGESEPDRWKVDEVLENFAWDEYFPKEVLDRLEGGRPNVKVFRDVLIGFLERDYTGKKGKSPPFSQKGYLEATETEDGEYIAKQARRKAFAKISEDFFDSDDYDAGGPRIQVRALDFETTEADLRLHFHVLRLSRVLNQVMTSPILSDKMGLKERRAFAARMWSLSFWNVLVLMH
ncbi:hypothetical protein N7481_011589 [Penicillium waksmanii]|uniref:uncharacterized protein n=1 Tax=Penicillium waksmanii TaxID=69791 RepID=UPI0025486A1C|nr:uncharacterized protein N7481_011589 [Penicillium waksmanii]KAJ5974379.1 hypothetical protein N7481_011589 [Penicillium waksmanii]